jgi:AraC-like DNA-binding protein
MVVWGPGFISASHRHHAVQLVMALQGALRVRRGPAEEWKSCGAALIRPDALHEVDASAGPVLIGFVDAESELGAALRERMRRDIVPLGARQVARWRSALKPPLSEAQVERWVKSQLLHRRRSVRIHPGVKRVLEYLRESLPVAEDFSLGKLAEISGLSRSRLMHVFTESIGVPIRPYLLWLRLQRAACDLMGGASVTAAAQNAGFSDAAHLTRTFRRMLGTTPTDLALRRRASRGVTMELVEVEATRTIQPERYRPRSQPS